jgi:hypothetical protein
MQVREVGQRGGWWRLDFRQRRLSAAISWFRRAAASSVCIRANSLVPACLQYTRNGGTTA